MMLQGEAREIAGDLPLSANTVVVLKKVLANMAQVDPPESTLATRGSCPDCGGAVEPEGGCLVCRSYGSSRCS